MKSIFKTGLLVLSLAAAFSFTQADTAFANIPKPKKSFAASLRAGSNEAFSEWRQAAEENDNDWEAHANLAILYYDQRNFILVQKHAQKAQKLFETYEIYGDDNLVREYMVKGAASAYHKSHRVLAENMLKRMLEYKLGGSVQHKNTYNGMAYYYLADIERGNGNYSKARSYINKAISYCPNNKTYLNYRDDFYHQNGKWNWRNDSKHRINYDMPKYDRQGSKRTTHKSLPPLRKPGSSYSSSQTIIKHTNEHKDTPKYDWKVKNHQDNKHPATNKAATTKPHKSTSITNNTNKPVKLHPNKDTSAEVQHKVQHPIVKQDHKVIKNSTEHQNFNKKEQHHVNKTNKEQLDISNKHPQNTTQSNTEQHKPVARNQHKAINTTNASK